jgi:hypothetical protein
VGSHDIIILFAIKMQKEVVVRGRGSNSTKEIKCGTQRSRRKKN